MSLIRRASTPIISRIFPSNPYWVDAMSFSVHQPNSESQLKAIVRTLVECCALIVINYKPCTQALVSLSHRIVNAVADDSDLSVRL